MFHGTVLFNQSDNLSNCPDFAGSNNLSAGDFINLNIGTRLQVVGLIEYEYFQIYREPGNRN